MPESSSSFKRGRRKTGGRKKGTPNTAPVEGRSLCRQLVTDKEYQRRFRERFVKGELPAYLEGMIWHFAFGKPRQTDEVQVDEGPARLQVTVVPSRV